MSTNEVACMMVGTPGAGVARAAILMAVVEGVIFGRIQVAARSSSMLGSWVPALWDAKDGRRVTVELTRCNTPTDTDLVDVQTALGMLGGSLSRPLLQANPAAPRPPACPVDPKTQAPDFNEINKAAHYNLHPGGIECIDVIRHMNFNCGNAVKYMWRNGLKPVADSELGVLHHDSPSAEVVGAVKDLNKAAYYILDEIKRLGGKVTVKVPKK